MKRVMIAGMAHETNMFNPFPTTYDDFVLRGLHFGDDLVEKLTGTNTESGGAIKVLRENGVEIVPSVYGFAMPAGLVTKDATERILGAMLDTLEKNEVDGIILNLHGAMVCESHDDGEGYILSRIREKVGADIPIAVTLDLHATLTPLMIEAADFITVYRSYPHMDMAERGEEAASALIRIMNGEIKPVMALAKPPLIIGPPLNVMPTDEPMRSIFVRARGIEANDPAVIAACPAHGFMQQDVPYAGVGAVVTTDNDLELAQRYADEIGDLLFKHRHDYQVDLPDAAETIRLAVNAENPPVAIADSGDNIGAGTPGDGTALLSEILKQGVDSAFVTLCDPEAAEQAAKAGVGATVTLAVGGKSDSLYGPPVTITGKVRTISDGVFLNRDWGGYWAGVVSSMGLTVRIDVGGITIMLNSHATSPNNILHAKSIGIYPEDYRMSICKGGLAFREAYKPPVVNSYIQSDTPGFSSSNMSNFTYTKCKRPIYPLDDI